MEKSALRKIYLEKRKSLSEIEINQLSEKILEQFLAYFDLSDVQNIHIFLPIKKQKEVDTLLFIKCFWELGKNVFVPKIYGEALWHHPLTPKTTLKANQWGILEPQNEALDLDFEMIIIPLLYSDNQGNRVGYGKGFYDRFLVKNPHTIKIGINFFSPNESIDNVENTDIPLDYLVCPVGVFSFKSKSMK